MHTCAVRFPPEPTHLFEKKKRGKEVNSSRLNASRGVSDLPSASFLPSILKTAAAESIGWLAGWLLSPYTDYLYIYVYTYNSRTLHLRYAVHAPCGRLTHNFYYCFVGKSYYGISHCVLKF